MPDGVNIDWGLAGQPVNAFGSYQTGFDLGRKAAGDRIQGNAMTAYMADPTAPVDPRLGAANPELAMKVYAAQQGATDHAAAVDATTAMASGDIDGAKAAIAPTGNFGAMGQILDWAKTASDEQKAAVAEKAGHVAQITTAIATMPADPSQPNGPLASPAQRLSVAQHMATIHPEYGIDPASLTVDQFTDDGIRATVAQQLGVKGMLEHDLAVHKQNTEDATAADTANYHAGQLKIDAGKLGVEQGQLHVAQRRLALESSPPGETPMPAIGAGGGVPITSVPASDRAVVQALVDGRYPIPSGAALRNPQVLKYLQEAAQVDPTFDGANYGSRVKTRNSFLAGPAAANITAINTTLGHLQTLSRAADDLHNAGGLLTLANSPLNFAAEKTGATAPGRFKAAAITAATELSKTLQGGAPHEAEIAYWTNLLSQDQAPAQLHGTISQMAELLNSRLQSVRDQYTQGMGRSATPLEVIHPHAAEALRQIRQLEAHAGNGLAAPAAGPGATSGERVYNPATGRLE